MKIMQFSDSRLKKICIMSCFIVLISACATSPTGRSQLRLFSENDLNNLGESAYADIKKKTKISKNRGINRYHQCIVDALVLANQPLQKYKSWELTVFEDKQANAFALPGGKIGVYTGLMKAAKNQHQLAAVIGHELAHVMAQHANERISTTYATQAGLSVIGGASGVGSQVMGLLGVGAQVGVLLPYGRTQESEADILGLEYMARAGFNPRESITLWENMRELGGDRPPEFLSTHPAESTRINQLQASQIDVEHYYLSAKRAGKRPNCGRHLK